MRAELAVFAAAAVLGFAAAGIVAARHADTILTWAEARHRDRLHRYAARHPARPGAVTTRPRQDRT